MSLVGLADVAIRGLVDSLAFRASAAPYLLLDTRLRIRAANAAYERATHHASPEMAGELMFDVFPDNPATPEARGVELLGRSLERVLASGEPDRMQLQRYDVLDGTGFVEKSWLPRNVPVRDPDGRIVGVLHHVEDVTHLLVTTALERDLVAPRDGSADPASTVGTEPVVEALVRDATARSARARMLVEGSRRAIAQMADRIDASGQL